MAAPRIIYIILRRMRPPLLVLLGSYAISLLGMTLIPGIDDQGKPWTMDFFHAYYFLSYTATTIGFGEIPYPFSDPQRAWVLVSIYLTVIAWFYAIGTILSLVQDPALRRVVVRGQFERQVRRIREQTYNCNLNTMSKENMSRKGEKQGAADCGGRVHSSLEACTARSAGPRFELPTAV